MENSKSIDLHKQKNIIVSIATEVKRTRTGLINGLGCMVTLNFSKVCSHGLIAMGFDKLSLAASSFYETTYSKLNAFGVTGIGGISARM